MRGRDLRNCIRLFASLICPFGHDEASLAKLSNKMEKLAQEREFFHFVDQTDKPSSVVDDHLSGMLITQHLKRHFPLKTGHGLACG